MNKAKLVGAQGKETGLSRTKAGQVVELFFGEMSNVLASGDRVEIRGFCSIHVKQYRGYAGRNPKSGEPVHIKPKKLLFFKCGQELKQRVDYPQTKTKGGKRR